MNTTLGTADQVERQKTMMTIQASPSKSLSLVKRSRTSGKYNSTATKSLGIRKNFSTLAYDIKPKILEGRLGLKQEFHGLSNNFKEIFARDVEDESIVIPIAGYAGHRRGEKAANLFGKVFRETSLESKRLQRQLMKSP
jgi:hypothetical protein